MAQLDPRIKAILDHYGLNSHLIEGTKLGKPVQVDVETLKRAIKNFLYEEYRHG